jgi:hypothetical protein
MAGYDPKKFDALVVGTRVRVLRPYAGSGRFGFDEHEGEWFVVGELPPGDLELARHPEDSWDVIVHASRVAGLSTHTDHPELAARGAT